jgi:TetR/AcrR family transcriptional regulator, repressor for uid operon
VSAPETPRLLALALDPSVLTDDDPMSERILDAALSLTAASGLRHLTMDDVARKAGVGRMTVYRRFASKTALVDALAVRECRRCLASVARAIDPDAAVVDRIASMFVSVLRVIREHPLLERLARVEPEALLAELTRNNSLVFRLVREFLVERVREAEAAGELGAIDAEVAAELGLRLGASFVLMPDSVLPMDDEAATHETVRALLAPVLAPA